MCTKNGQSKQLFGTCELTADRRSSPSSRGCLEGCYQGNALELGHQPESLLLGYWLFTYQNASTIYIVTVTKRCPAKRHQSAQYETSELGGCIDAVVHKQSTENKVISSVLRRVADHCFDVLSCLAACVATQEVLWASAGVGRGHLLT